MFFTVSWSLPQTWSHATSLFIDQIPGWWSSCNCRTTCLRMDSGTMILGLLVDTSVCRINPEGSCLEEQVREEELISFLTSLQDFWAAANSSMVKKVMAFS